MPFRRFREIEEDYASKRRSLYSNYDDDSHRYNPNPARRDRRSNYINRYENNENRDQRRYDVNDRYDNGRNRNFEGRNYESRRRYFNNDRSRSPQFRDNHFQSSRSNSFNRSRSRDRNCGRHYSPDRDRQMRYRNNYNQNRENAVNHQRNRFNDNRRENRRNFNNRRYQNKRKRSDERSHEDDTKNLNTERYGSEQKNDKESTNERNKVCDGRNHDEEDHAIETGAQSENNCDTSNLEDEKYDQPQQDNVEPTINYDEEDDRTIKRRKIGDIDTENNEKLESGLQSENSNDTSSGNTNEILPEEECNPQENKEESANKTNLSCEDRNTDEIDEVYTENSGKPESEVQYEINDISSGNANEEIFGNEDDYLVDDLSDEEYDPLNSGYLNDMLCDEKTNLDTTE